MVTDMDSWNGIPREKLLFERTSSLMNYHVDLVKFTNGFNLKLSTPYSIFAHVLYISIEGHIIFDEKLVELLILNHIVYCLCSILLV